MAPITEQIIARIKAFMHIAIPTPATVFIIISLVLTPNLNIWTVCKHTVLLCLFVSFYNYNKNNISLRNMDIILNRPTKSKAC